MTLRIVLSRSSLMLIRSRFDLSHALKWNSFYFVELSESDY
jgi:hypothetical protein